ncbi:MAG TPA: DUF1761 domain-containing protein [Candidatus Acidoferrales bacterium]|nr:DUF1761 domain-containing protein [Candidatus Acidoferrales bacterium]
MKTNYAAVIVAAIVYWLLAALWYGLIFSKQWKALESAAGAHYQSPNLSNSVISYILGLLTAYILAQICAWRMANTAARGAAIGILLWIGFVGPVTLTTFMYEGRSLRLFALDEFYPLFGLALMGAILGAWKKKIA